MTEETRSIISIVFGLLVSVPFFINKVFKGESWKSKFIEQASKENCFTKAACVDAKRNYGTGEGEHSDYVREDTMKVKYEYQVNGKKYYKKLTFMSNGKVSIDYPYEITVYYRKNNPKKSIAKEETRKSSGCLIGIVIFFSVVFIISNLLKIIIK